MNSDRVLLHIKVLCIEFMKKACLHNVVTMNRHTCSAYLHPRKIYVSARVSVSLTLIILTNVIEFWSSRTTLVSPLFWVW